jgi:hypothetical protein
MSCHEGRWILRKARWWEWSGGTLLLMGRDWGGGMTGRELEEARRWHWRKVVVVPHIVECCKLIGVVTEITKDGTTYQRMRTATVEGAGMWMSLM